MKMIVNWPLCDGNGACAMEAPEMFALDDHDKLNLLMEEFPESYKQKAQAAVRACPKHALKIGG